MSRMTKAAVQLWTLTAIAGFTFGNLMPILNLVVAEIKGIGRRYAGTSISIGSGIGGGAGLIFAPVSEELALTSAILPSIFGPLFMPCLSYPLLFYQKDRNQNFRDSSEQQPIK